MATRQQKKVGGMNEQPLTADEEIQGFVNQVKSSTEEAIGRKFDMFQAKLYKTQLVNGINYFVKVQTGDKEFVHVRLHKTFSGVVTFHSCQDGKTETEELTYFN